MKKIFSLLLALTLVFALGASAFADDTVITADGGQSGDTMVEYTVPTKYTVTIPEKVTLLDGSAVPGNLVVAIDHLPDAHHIDAAITAVNGVGYDEEGVTFAVVLDGHALAYDVGYSSDGTSYSEYTLGQDVGGVNGEGGTIYFSYILGDSTALPAGDYSGSVTFAISVREDMTK